MTAPASVMVVAGEASGDLHGAALCRALTELRPGLRLFGMGGRGMAGAGLGTLADLTGSAAVGWTEAAGRVPALIRTFRALADAVRRERPAALVLIDFPEFNLRLARVGREAGVPVVYFIPPQIWAWRGGRVRTIRRRVSLVLAVLPFEAALYQAARVPVEYVGHPIVDAVAGAPDRPAARASLGLPADVPVIGLLPGSRREEVTRMLPVMREGASVVARSWPGARFLVALAPTVAPEHLPAEPGGPRLEAVAGRTHAVIRAADLVVVTSGTATLEAALLGTPMVVCYRLSPVSEAFTRLLIRVPWISLVNLVLGRGAVPELYQRHATGAAIGDAASGLLRDRAAGDRQRRAFRELSALCGTPGVSRRAARHVLAVGGLG